MPKKKKRFVYFVLLVCWFSSNFLFQRMGNIDDAVPFFGQGFNRIYPLIMVIYTVLVAVNFFGRVIDYFGNWKRFRLRNEEEDMNGFDQSGIIILQKGKLDKFTLALLCYMLVALPCTPFQPSREIFYNVPLNHFPHESAHLWTSLSRFYKSACPFN